MTKWMIKSQDEQKVREICAKFGCGEVAARVLYNRGLICDEDIERFFDIDISNFHNPFLLSDMDSAVLRIKDAIAGNEKITVYGDYDVDGITSVVLLYKYLKSSGANVDYYIPDRAEEGYGLNSAALRTIHESGTTLIITVDTGTTAVDEIAEAVSYGLDVVVTDHHECKPELPHCVAVINPKRSDTEYPFKELAGVGVVFKLVCALMGDVNKAFENYGDLVAIGTIADIMPLVDENRDLVSLGVDILRKRPCFGIKALLEASGGYKSGQVSASTIAFQIAPRLNAAGRIGDPSHSVELLLCENADVAKVLAEGLCEENRIRRQKENSILDDVERMIADRNPDDKIIVVGADGWHHGVIGIVASKIVEKYHLPCILVCFDGDKAKGSARSIKNVSMFELLTLASAHLEKFGGHDMAAGLTLNRNDFEYFVKDITAIANEKITEEMMIPVIESECEVAFDDICLATVDNLLKLEPFGTGNPLPQFMLEEVTVSDVIAVGAGSHLKIKFSGSCGEFSGMLFNTTLNEFDFAVNDKVDMVFTMSDNYFNNKRYLSVQIKSIRLCKEFERKEKQAEDMLRLYDTIHSVYDEMCFTRSEFTYIYKFLHRQYVNTQQTEYMPHALARTFESKGLKRFNYCKLMLCLRVLNELGIIDYTYEKSVRIMFKDTVSKKQLANSKTWCAVGGEDNE